MRQDAFEFAQEFYRAALADVMAIEVLQLCEIETCRRAPDLRQIECCNHFVRGKNLLVAMSPAKPDQIITHRLRQVAHGPIGIDPKRPMAFGELGSVGAVDEWNMRHR